MRPSPGPTYIPIDIDDADFTSTLTPATNHDNANLLIRALWLAKFSLLTSWIVCSITILTGSFAITSQAVTITIGTTSAILFGLSAVACMAIQACLSLRAVQVPKSPPWPDA